MTVDSDRIIDSRYALIAKLGEGGMGEVYTALDGLTREIVAFKQVRIAADAHQHDPRQTRGVSGEQGGPAGAGTIAAGLNRGGSSLP